MSERTPRLGDVVDDYCTRCRLVLNHGIVGLVGEELKRVRCNTCMTEHDYKHGKIPRRKDQVKELFDQVLARLPNQPPAPSSAAEPKPKPARRRSLRLGLRERMAELRAKAEEEQQQASRDKARGGKRRGRGKRGGRKGRRQRKPG